MDRSFGRVALCSARTASTEATASIFVALLWTVGLIVVVEAKAGEGKGEGEEGERKEVAT